jgi:hypothetical protein
MPMPTLSGSRVRRISAALTDSDGLVQQAARDALAHLVETVPSVRSTVAQALRSK